jgi:hypothetical protein
VHVRVAPPHRRHCCACSAPLPLLLCSASVLLVTGLVIE